MKKINKKITYKLFIVITLFLSCLGLSGCFGDAQKSAFDRAKERIYSITEINVPTEARTIYSMYDNTFANGRRAQLVVFEFDIEPTEWLLNNGFLSSKDETLTENGFETMVDQDIWYFQQYFGFLTIDWKEEIPKEYQPNFELEYLWKRESSGVHFYYYISNQRLIVCITGN